MNLHAITYTSSLVEALVELLKEKWSAYPYDFKAEDDVLWERNAGGTWYVGDKDYWTAYFRERGKLP